MAGDKGAEAPKDVQEYLQKPKAVESTLDYYSKRRSGAFRASISRAIDHLRQRGRQLPTNETSRRIRDAYGDLTAEERAKVGQEFGGTRPNESFLDADTRHDEAVTKVISERSPTESKTAKPEE